MFKIQSTLNDEVKKRDEEIAALSMQINEFRHNNEIKQMKIDQLQTELKLVSNKNVTLSEPQQQPIHSEDKKVVQNDLSKKEIKSNPSSIGQSTKRNYAKMQSLESQDQKWIKVVGKEDSALNKDDHAALLDKAINLLENSLNKSKMELKNSGKEAEKKKQNKKDDSIMQLFTQTIEECQESNGFFELPKNVSARPGSSKIELPYVEAVRKQEDRNKLKGIACKDCKQVTI